MRSISTNAKITCFFVFIFAFVFSPGWAWADWQKMDPPPDVDKSAHNHTGQPSCWLAAASNMLAGAGYGDGNNVQERTDDIYLELVDICKARNNNQIVAGWTDTALNWWLMRQFAASPPYRVVTVHGNKILSAWQQPNLPRIIGNHLRDCSMVGIDIYWSNNNIGHAITAWGDNADANELTTNPTQLKVTDSDFDYGGQDVQTYTYDSYANGWLFNYKYSFTNHPAIRHIVTLSPVDINDPNASVCTNTVYGSYIIVQTNPGQNADGLHYDVGAGLSLFGGGSATIYTYRTEIDWQTAGPPTIAENDPRTDIMVDWGLTGNPVPYNTWVKIDTELVIPIYPPPNLNIMHWVMYRNVYFSYPIGGAGPNMPCFELTVERPEVADPNVPNVCGGYVVGAFDFFANPEGTVLRGRYRFQHEYDYFQDPESCEISLEPTGGVPTYYVGNFRFGHSYGYLDDESLWEFDDWMTEDPNVQQFGPGDYIPFPLDWEDRLPYPDPNSYIAPEPNDCGDPGTVYLPQDLNKDCRIDFSDFAFFAGGWLQCTEPNDPNCDPYWK